jgi:acyl-CoA thioesterase I
MSIDRRQILAALAIGSVLTPAVSRGQTRPFSLVMLGDSVTAGFGLRRTEAPPARMETRLQRAGVNIRVANAGVSGDTSAGGLARFSFAVPDGTDAVLIALGGNDMLQGVDPDETRANLDGMIRAAKARGIRPALSGMQAPSNWGADYRARFDAIWPALARTHRIPLDPFLLAGVALDPALNQPDGIHPTAPGADRIAVRLSLFAIASFGLRATLPRGTAGG